MIKETDIDAIVLAMQEEGYKDGFVEGAEEYWHYLNSESFQGLSDKEHELLFFLNAVVYNVVESVEGATLEFAMPLFQDGEEDNWQVREEESNWASAADMFFEGYAEEDLLAFVEDMLNSEESDDLTEIGKEVLFITTKSYIDLVMSEAGQES